MSVVSQVNNTYVGSLQTPTDTVTNAIGLSAIDALGQSVSNIGQMVNFNQKTIFTNFIGKFDKIPIQVIDPINISNGLTVGGTAFTGGSASSITTINQGGTTINISTSGSIQFAINSSLVINLNEEGGFQYNPSSSVSSSLFQINGQLITSSFQFCNGAVSSYFLQAIDSTGKSQWATVPFLRNSTLQESLVLNGPAGFQQGFQFQTLGSSAGTQGFIDANSNWFVGAPDYVENADLIASNGVLVTSNLRVKGGQVGYLLQQQNAYGDLGWASPLSTNLYITNQINCNLSSSVTAQAGNISFAINGAEAMRLNSNGFLGIGTASPKGSLDVVGRSFLSGGLRLTNLDADPIFNPSTGYVLTCIDNQGNAVWNPPQGPDDGPSGIISEPENLFFLGQVVVSVSTVSNVLASAGPVPVTFDVSGNMIATSYQGNGTNGILFNGFGSNTTLAVITSNGYMGIGTVNPGATLEVAGSAIIDLALTVSNNITTGGTFIGDGSQITNILPGNVGIGANQLSAFYTTTRTSLSNQSFLISTNFSTLYGLAHSELDGASGNTSSLSTTVANNFLTLSTLSYNINSTLSSIFASNFITLSSISASDFVTLSTLTSVTSSNLSTATSRQLSTVSNGLFSTLSSQIRFTNSQFSTYYVSSIQYASTAVGRLSTLIGPGWYYTSSLIGLISSGGGGGGSFDYNYAAAIVVDTLRAGIDFQQIVVGSQLPNPRDTPFYTSVDYLLRYSYLYYHPVIAFKDLISTEVNLFSFVLSTASSF